MAKPIQLILTYNFEDEDTIDDLNYKNLKKIIFKDHQVLNQDQIK